MRQRASSGRRDAGFTLIELLIVVAIIGIIAAMALPALQRAMLKARVNRFASDAVTLHKAFLQYFVDNSLYPSTATPANRAFDKATLAPLVAGGYVKTPGPILQALQGRKVTDYDSPNVDSADTEYYAVLTLAGLPSVQVVIGDTSQFPGFLGQHFQGGYFVVGNRLYPLDTDVLALLGK